MSSVAKLFTRTSEVAEASEVLAINQGLYNGFIAADFLFGGTKPGLTMPSDPMTSAVSVPG